MQNKVSEFNKLRNCHTEPMPAMARVLDIQSEVGELAKEVLKSTKYGTKEFVKTEDFELELGDVLYSLLSLADEMGVDAGSSLDKVIEKYRKRIESNDSMGSGR